MQGPGGVICPADGRSRGRRGCAVFLGTLLGPDIGCAVQNSHLGRGPDFTLETLVLAPDTTALQNNLCFSYYQGRNWTLAETCYRKTPTRQPHNQAARNNLGLLLCRQGRQEEARRLWQEAEGEAAAPEKLAKALAPPPHGPRLSWLGSPGIVHRPGPNPGCG